MSRGLRDRSKSGAIIVVVAVFLFPAVVFAKSGAIPCDHALKNVRVRPANASSGSKFAREVAMLTEHEREKAIEEELLAGNIPPFLTRLVPVQLSGRTANGAMTRVTLCVAPDYLAIGSERDFIFVPMRLATALRVARHFDAVLPTSKIVDAVYEQAEVRLAPQPLPAGDQMRSTAYYARHNELIRQQEETFGAALGNLIAGDKKDLVLTGRLWRMSDRVAIYGWHRGSHEPIQPLSTVHGARYADYSHGVRLVGAEADVDDEPRPLLAVLDDPQLAPVVSNEGAIPRISELVAVLSVAPSEASQ